MRVDANVSIHAPDEQLGVRTEIKNIGSVRGVASAINYEIKRQIKMRENGQEVYNETRAWDPMSKKTVSMRDKESKQVRNLKSFEYLNTECMYYCLK